MTPDIEAIRQELASGELPDYSTVAALCDEIALRRTEVRLLCDEIERLQEQYDALLEHDCESMARAAIDRWERDAALAECERLRSRMNGPELFGENLVVGRIIDERDAWRACADLFAARVLCARAREGYHDLKTLELARCGECLSCMALAVYEQLKGAGS